MPSYSAYAYTHNRQSHGLDSQVYAPAASHQARYDTTEVREKSLANSLERHMDNRLNPLIESTESTEALRVQETAIPESRFEYPAKPDLFKPLPKEPKPRWSAWRVTTAWGCGSAVVVLIINIVLLGWSYNKPRSASNNILLYSGDCNESRKIDTVTHLFINILGTVLLGASNYAMQVLCAPTRDALDIAHSQGKCVRLAVA